MSADGPRSPHGIYAAALTPFSEGGEIAHALLARHCVEMLARGCDGVSLFGTTGEANSLTVSERMVALERIVAAGVAPARLMPGTGCCALADTVALTKHALALGVTDALVLPPFYYKGVSDDGLFDAYANAVETVADDRLRLYLYHIPQFSGVALGFDLIARLRAAYPTTIVGIKDSSGDRQNIENLCKLENFGVFVGAERLIVPALAAGSVGTICALANVEPETLAALYARRSTSEAQSLQHRVSLQLDLLDRYGFIPALKALRSQRDAIDTWARVRPPLRALPQPQRIELATAFHQPALAT